MPIVEHLLTLVTVESQDVAVSLEGNNTVPVIDVTKSPVTTSSPLHLEHVEVQEVPIDDLVDTITGNDAEATQDVTEGTTIDVDNVDREVSPTVQFLGAEFAEMEETNRPIIVREEGMTHTNPRIQQDLDLWQKIKDYDQRSAENPFVPVLSKKQKQM